jgi:hypothetical protein
MAKIDKLITTKQANQGKHYNTQDKKPDNKTPTTGLFFRFTHTNLSHISNVNYV